MNAEFGDKTFLLITLFTMAWSTWHLKEHSGDEEVDHNQVEEKALREEENKQDEPLKEGGDDVDETPEPENAQLLDDQL